MESLIRQTRVRFSDVGQQSKEGVSNNRDRGLPLHKTQSFKGGKPASSAQLAEKKKQQNWFQRQFSRQMSQEYDPNNGGEYSAAIAAAAFAVKSMEDSKIKEQKKIIEEHEKTFSSIKSRKENTISPAPEAGKKSKRFSEPSIRKPDNSDKALPTNASEHGNIPVKSPSIKKASTFAEKQPINPSTKKPDIVLPKPEIPYAKQPILPPTNIRRLSSTKPGEETEADAWEKAELAKIKERYETLSMTIRDWENKKKSKAKQKKDKTESELELRRAKALRNFRRDMERIDQIASGARAQAEKNRRNEEFKAKEKANRIRITGKIPPTCLCF